MNRISERNLLEFLRHLELQCFWPGFGEVKLSSQKWHCFQFRIERHSVKIPFDFFALLLQAFVQYLSLSLFGLNGIPQYVQSTSLDGLIRYF